MIYKHTPADINRAIQLGVHWQDHTPTELYLLHKGQQASNRLAHWTDAICVTAGTAMIAALTMGWV
jgi:hypothetical protein